MDYKDIHEQAIAMARLLVSEGKLSQEIAENMFPELRESDDERIRKAILGLTYLDGIEPILTKCSITAGDIRTYLEKQKEQKPFSTEETELNSIAFLEQLGYTCIPPESEKKPVEYLDKHKVSAIIIRLHELALSRLIPINSDVFKKIGEITSDVRSLLDYSIEQKEQKPAEWSEEDEQYLLVCKNALNKYQRSDHWDANIISQWLEERLKSLRPQPHWKPSEEQMEGH